MSSIQIVDGNLLESQAKYIAHQVNCVSHGAAGLAAELFARYPHANIYSRRVDSDSKDEPGTIVISGNGEGERFIINMMGQYYPGRPKYIDSELDGARARKRHFFHCLTRIAEIPDLESIAFPYGIGCGLAGGAWDEYRSLIEKFAAFVCDRASVSIIKLPRSTVSPSVV